MTDYLFDDGTIESKVLQYELRQERPQIITVDKFENINKWLESIDIDQTQDITKVYLHLCYEQITPGIRAEINTALANNPHLRIILKYENMDKRTIENLAKKYGIKPSIKQEMYEGLMTLNDVDKIWGDNKDKIKLIDYNKEKAANYGKYSVGGESKEVPAFIPHDNPEPVVDNFANKSNWFKDKDKRRRKRKQE